MSFGVLCSVGAWVYILCVNIYLYNAYYAVSGR